MIAMILCGGEGKRLRPITSKIPKPLIQLKPGFCILDKLLLMIKGAGMKQVVLLTGHLGHKIRARYGRQHLEMELLYTHEQELLGSMGAVQLGRELVGKDQDLVVMNGDIVTDLNLGSMIQHFRCSNYLASMYITRMRSPYGLLRFEGDRILEFQEKPMLDHYLNAGVYCLSSQLQLKPKGSLEQDLFPELARMGKLGCYREDEALWLSVETIKDLGEARAELSSREEHVWGYRRILPNGYQYYLKSGFQIQLDSGGELSLELGQLETPLGEPIPNSGHVDPGFKLRARLNSRFSLIPD